MNLRPNPSLLIVEDDLKLRKTIELEFQDRGYEVHSASCLRDLYTISLESLRFAVVDLRIGVDNGLTAVEYIKSKFPLCRIVMITGYGSIATAVAAMKLGASNYLTKPFDISTLEQHLWIDQVGIEEVNAHIQRESLDHHEREYIEHVLVKCEGNISRAAKWLNIHRQSLQRKLKKYPPRV